MLVASDNTSPSGVAAVRRITTSLLVALAVVGCSRGPVQLLTGAPQSCSDPGFDFVEGQLLADARAGTVIKIGLMASHTNIIITPGPSPRELTPVMWPAGFKGRWGSGNQVEVMDSEGKVVATTGMTYRLARTNRDFNPGDVFPACGPVTPLP